MTDIPQTPEAIAYKLMQDLIRADKKELIMGGATKQDIIQAYEMTAHAVNQVRGQR
jgi:hypothetical protein